MSKWMAAVKAWNEKQKSVNPKHCFCMPRKGTPEHAAVMAHMKGESSKPDHPEKDSRRAEIEAFLAMDKSGYLGGPPKAPTEEERKAHAEKGKEKARKHEESVDRRKAAAKKIREAKKAQKEAVGAADNKSHRDKIIEVLMDGLRK